MPTVPERDPATAIMADPSVPEHKRRCGNCDAPVGRGRNGMPGRSEGYCPKCGTRFSFTPKLGPGDVVAGQYEVLGCLAHGGLGWIYLAKDHNVSDRWVVLKGLLDTGDRDAMEAAVAERRFLAEVEHPNVVKIYNFVRHGDAGYIVMEYVGGESLKDLVLERRGAGDPLTPAQVMAYGLEVLRALGHLHDRGLVYCDFKPDNAIQTEEQLKLVDLGGVRRLDDDEGAVYGTVGYQAPEIADEGPSVASDLYTVARAMAVMSFEFSGYTGVHRFGLPPAEDVPVLAAHPSFDRLLRRAAHPDPGERFWSAGEMSEQLTGVLRETLAVADGRPRPAVSTLFGPETRVVGARMGRPPTFREAASALPVPLVDPDDPGARRVAALAASAPEQVVEALDGVPGRSVEETFRLVRALIDRRDGERARELLLTLDESDWRAHWFWGVAALAEGDGAAALGEFGRVYDLLPGEPAVKLAMAFAAEALGDAAGAVHFHRTVWRTDHAYENAVFGLARTLVAEGGDRAAVEALDEVPASSGRYLDAQVAAIVVTVRGWAPGADPARWRATRSELLAAAERAESLDLPEERGGRVVALLLEALIAELAENGSPPGDRSVLGVPYRERALRAALEGVYRDLARLSTARTRRRAYVDRANTIRPRTAF
ncbi:serine/threonine-protein kinase [Actinomadura gamaensis]|uniref:non-specific serine/threonine protein kinase n=1 Tax=Actinomadura gamaensis TaxID=1763541 RepID=A0ABV9U8P0_9ACTN